MRVLYFTQGFTPHDFRFLNSLAEDTQEVQEVFYLRLEKGGRQVEDRALPPNVQQVHWRGGQGPFHWRDVPALALSLRQVLRQVQPDVLHAGPIQTVAFLAALSGYQPLVSMSWGSDLLRDADQSRVYRWITRYTLGRSRVLVGDCEAVRQKAATFGFPPQRAYLFPWGIDLQRFSPGSVQEVAEAHAWRERLGWQDSFVVLSLRSWEPVYGVDVVVRGFARAAQHNPDLRLALVGGGSLAGQIQSLIEQYGLRERVWLGGQVSQKDLPRLYRSADLYVSASHSDGSSVSLMEALGCGLPVLVSDIPGNREWVQPAQGAPGGVGWLFADGDAHGLAQGILRAAEMKGPERSNRASPACAEEEGGSRTAPTGDAAMAGSEEDEEGVSRMVPTGDVANAKNELVLMGQRARALAERRADWNTNFQVLLQAYQAAMNRTQSP